MEIQCLMWMCTRRLMMIQRYDGAMGRAEETRGERVNERRSGEGLRESN